jgi:hypothetical protein
VSLELLEERRFGNGIILLQCRVSPGTRPDRNQRDDIMRSFTVLLSTFVLVACRTTPADRGLSNPQNASADPAIEFLLTSAATDFHTHRPPYLTRFRGVRSGYVVTTAGTRQYRLCGEFLAAQESGKTEWAPFVTIKTSGYEQWLGAPASSFCGGPSITWNKEDLSSSLKSRLDALR